MELSKRMQAVAAMAPKGSIAADVGCDHGFISIWLIQNGVCPHVFAADVRPGPLARAKEHIARCGLEQYITTILSDGLKNVPVGTESGLCAGEDERPCAGADLMIAAGMGGRLTVRILDDAPEKTARLSTLILEPQSEVWLVRRWFNENRFVITDEELVFEDGKYYPVIRAENAALSGGEQLLAEEAKRNAALKCAWLAAGGETDDFEAAAAIYGPCLMRTKGPVFLSFLAHTIEKDAGLLEKLPTCEDGSVHNADRLNARRRELSRRLAIAGCAQRLEAVRV